MTAVASPPTLQPLQHLGWNSGGGKDDFGSIDTENAPRIFLPRKALQRQNSSSSTSSDSSTGTTISVNASTNTSVSESEGGGAAFNSTADREAWPGNKKVKSLWPVQRVEGAAGRPIASQSNPAGPSNTSQGPGILQNNMQNAQQAGNGRVLQHAGGSEPQALLVLVPMNATFERKSIQVPTFPEILRIGRQTNAKTVPTPANGYFDSKVLSRQHAEVWADRNGKVWIRDVKSSNGTFVNGTRLSPESRDSEPHELRENDSLELGIDIVSEDQKSIVHHKVSAKVEHAGFPNSSSNVMDLNFGDIDPGANSGLITSSMPNGGGMRPRLGSQNSMSSVNSLHSQAGLRGAQVTGVQRHMNAFLAPVTVESVMKQLSNELRKAKQQSTDISKTSEFFGALIAAEPGQELPKAPDSILPQKQSSSHQLHPNGLLPHKVDSLSPFSAPPAPPPQLPLPDKPDGSRSASEHVSLPFRRSAPDLPQLPNGKHESPPSSQILSLVDTLNSTRRELDLQGNRVKELEELLKQERRARELAEERARLLANRHPILGQAADNEKGHPFTPPLDESKMPEINGLKALEDDISDTSSEADTIIIHSEPLQMSIEDAKRETAHVDSTTSVIQERLTRMVNQMEDLRQQLDDQRTRADSAETERDSLVTMIQRIREAELTKASPKKRKDKNLLQEDPAEGNKALSAMQSDGSGAEDGLEEIAREAILAANGKPATPDGDKEKQILELQEALAQALTRAAQPQSGSLALSQSAPYASMLGVLLVGISAMMYLNGWQKAERS